MAKFLWKCGIQGCAAWCAYAVVEFVFSSILYIVVRPYAIFTPWLWRMTGLLVAAEAGAGFVLGALAGLAAWKLGRRGPGAAQACATMTLAIAFAVNVAANPLTLNGKFVLIGAGIAFAAILAAASSSGSWAGRLGWLTNAWVVSGLLLGLGQEFALLQLEDSARTMGAKLWVWAALLAALWLMTAIGSMVLGRYLHRLGGDRMTIAAPNWAAAGLAFSLVACGLWFGSESPARAQGTAAAGSPSRPNVLVLVMDTVRADHLALYGYSRRTTPHLAELARDSAVYTRAFAPSDMTLASHASLFTGLYPSWHGAYCRPPESAYGHELSRSAVTLAEMLASRGYLTLGVSANVYLRAEFGLQRGFAEFRIPRPLPVLPSESYWYLLRTGMRRLLNHVTDTSQSDRLFSRGEDIDREAFALLESHEPSSAPLFLFLNYMDAHFPYIPPAPFDRLFPGKDRGIVQEDMEETSDRVVRGKAMPEPEHRHRVSQYDGGISYMDAQIGLLMNWLRERNLYDNTLVVVTADHGEAFGEKNLVLHANSVYQNLLHVPLLIKFPRGLNAGVVETPVSLIDVAPTVLAALGYPAPERMQGRDLAAANGIGARRLYSESFPCPSAHPPECREGCMERAALDWPHKLITSSTGKREFYDLERDPYERRNLYASEPQARALAQDLEGWMKTMPAQTTGRSQMDAETARRLKSLGYVQ